MAAAPDTTLVPDRGRLAVRVRTTLFGLQVDAAVDGEAARPCKAPRYATLAGRRQRLAVLIISPVPVGVLGDIRAGVTTASKQ